MVENEPDSGFIHTQIQNINYLYPSIEPDTYLSHKFFDAKSHTLDISRIKATLKENVTNTFPKNLSSKSQNKNKPAQDLIEKSVLFHLLHTLSDSYSEGPPPLVSNYYTQMNLTNSGDEILSSLHETIDGISAQDILSTYNELLNGDRKENRYLDYKTVLLEDLKKTKAIPSKTLSRLFKTVLPALFTLTNEENSKLANQLTESRTDLIISQVASLGQ
jgi:hypothetical protein